MCNGSKSAAAGGLDVGGIMEGSKTMIESALKAATQLNVDAYEGESGFPYWIQVRVKRKVPWTCANWCADAVLGHTQAMDAGNLCNYIKNKQMPTEYQPTHIICTIICWRVRMVVTAGKSGTKS